MKRVGELYEVVVFTASVSKVSTVAMVISNRTVLTFANQYGDPLLDQLDIHKVVHHRLFRESCYNHQGNYVKVCGTSEGPSLSKTMILILWLGPLPSRPWPQRDYHYWQLSYLVYFPPAACCAHKQLVLGCPWQRTSGSYSRSRGPRRFTSPRC